MSSPFTRRIACCLTLALVSLFPAAADEPELLPPGPSMDSSGGSSSERGTAPTSALATREAAKPPLATSAPAMVHLSGEGIAGTVWVDFEPRGELPLRWEASARVSQLVRIVGTDFNPVNFRVPPSAGPLEVRLNRDPTKAAQIQVSIDNRIAELIPAKPPRATQVSAPEFPGEMRRTGKGGTVTVRFTITTEGSVASLVVLSSTNSGFNQAALSAVAQWRFKPGELEGRPIEYVAVQPLHFTLQK